MYDLYLVITTIKAYRKINGASTWFVKSCGRLNVHYASSITWILDEFWCADTLFTELWFNQILGYEIEKLLETDTGTREMNISIIIR